MELEFKSKAAWTLLDNCQAGCWGGVLNVLRQSSSHIIKEATDYRGVSPLHFASQHGWLDIIQLLVEKFNCNPEVRAHTQSVFDRVDLLWCSQVTPLHLACQYGMVEVVKLLVERYQCNPNNSTLPLNLTPLHYACDCGKVQVAKVLTKQYKCDPNVQDMYGRTPLNLACQNEHKDVVKLLITINECDLNIADESGSTPLHHACDFEIDIAILKGLITHGADPNLADNDGNTPLHKLCSTGQLEHVKSLLRLSECELDLNIQNKNGFTALYLYVSSQRFFNPEIIKELSIIRTANPNISDKIGNSPLHIACQSGCLDSVRCLLRVKTCDPNITNNIGLTPLQVTSPEYSSILKELVTHGANPNVTDINSNTPLHIACEAGKLDSVKSVLVAKCDPNAKNKDGLVPLQVTSLRDSSILKELLKHGADPNVVDRNGNTSLHNACYDRKLMSVKILLTVAKCDPNAKNKAGLTPLEVDLNSKSLYHAADFNITLELIAHGADPNTADNDGNTPLHSACYYRKLDFVKWLLRVAKCNPNAKNKLHGLTPLQYHVNLNFLCQTLSEFDDESGFMEEFIIHKHSPTMLDHSIMIELLAHGANPNIIDRDGNTPLHKACEAGMPGFVKCLLSITTCDPSIKNKAGLTPIQVISPKHSHIMEALITHEANPNVIDSCSGNTLLHNACSVGELSSIKYLLTNCDPDLNAMNRYGLTPLLMTSLRDTSIIKELLEHGADPNVVDTNGNTLLHKACYFGQVQTVKWIVAKCDLNIKNKDGLTPLEVDLRTKSFSYTDFDITKELIAHGADPNMTDVNGNTPLHNACHYRRLDSIKWLLTEAKCNLNAKNKDGLTPLHYLVNFNYLWYCNTQAESDDDKGTMESIAHGVNPDLDHHIIIELLAHGADPNVTDSDGNTPLHKACEAGMLNFVKCLLAEKACDSNIKNKAGLTLIQVTSPKHSHIIKELMTHGANPNVPDSNGNTPLHKACEAIQFDSVKYLLMVKKCNPNIPNNTGLTPIQVISPHYSNIINELIVRGANANVVDSDGNTPLHIACQELNFDTVKCLLRAADCDPNAKNKDGLTPLAMTSINSTTIIRELIRNGANASDVFRKTLKEPLNPPVKVFVVGNPSAGKSTLTAALQKESSAFRRRFKPSQKVKGVDTKTAGVVPHEFKSKEYGYTIFYDFAGQREFYGSHAALLQNAIQSSPPIFLLVVDLRESEEKMKQIVLYWLTFLENQCASMNANAHIIFVGSHADVLQQRGEDPKLNSCFLNPDILLPFPRFTFAGFISMDCQYPESRGMDELRQCLKGSCNALRMRETISFNSHCFYIYLADKFKHSIAITAEQIHVQIKAELLSPDSSKSDLTSFVPDDLLRLCKICDELNDRGHILFLKDSQNIAQSWVVMDKKSLLAQVSGSIFAPEHFKQHTIITQCSCSTGVVPLSSIANSFEVDSTLLIKFLSSLEFCHEISDSKVVEQITANHQTCVINQPASNERYFLFPALVSLNVPLHVWDDKPEFKHVFGWMLRCGNDRTEQFFTSRFLQVLLLRLAFSFPLSEGHKHNHDNPAIQRNCSIWKNGIFWGNDYGVETLVEVTSDNQAVIVLMRCGESAIVDLVHLRSQILQQVLKAAEDFCSRIIIDESFIDPLECNRYPLKPVSHLKCYSLLSTSKAVIDAKPAATVVSPTGTIPLKILIQCEPYCGLGEDILWQIFENQDKTTEIIPESFLSRLAEVMTRNLELFTKIFNHKATTEDLFSVLLTWRATCAGTYKSLRQKLDAFSVFAARNLLELAGRQEKPNPQLNLLPAKVDELTTPSITSSTAKSDQKPTLKLLQSIQNDSGKRVKVIESVAAEWEQLAIALGFDPPVIDCLRRDFNRDAKGAATQILTKWLSGESDLDQPITWDTLIQCLDDAGQVSLAKDLADILLH